MKKIFLIVLFAIFLAFVVIGAGISSNKHHFGNPNNRNISILY